MALIKEVELDTGVKVEYWKIQEIKLNFISKEFCVVDIKVIGFLDKNARLNNKKSIMSIDFNNINIDVENGKLLVVCYNALKQEAFFNNAEDDL